MEVPETAHEFELDGQLYLYLPESVATDLTGFKSYLGDWFTPSFAEAIAAELGLIEHEGRLAFSNIGISVELEMDNAAIELLNDGRTKKEYRFEVPISNEEHLVAFTVTYLLKQGTWLIDDLVGEPCPHCS